MHLRTYLFFLKEPVPPCRRGPVVGEGIVPWCIGHSYSEKHMSKNNDNSISTTYWYPLKVDDYQQYEVEGPALLRIFTRIQTSINLNNEEYYLRIREDGYDLGTIYFKSELSELSSIVKNGEPLTKWRSTWLNVPSGKHYYTFTSPNINNNHSKNIFVRIKKWESQK